MAIQNMGSQHLRHEGVGQVGVVGALGGHRGHAARGVDAAGEHAVPHAIEVAQDVVGGGDVHVQVVHQAVDALASGGVGECAKRALEERDPLE